MNQIREIALDSLTFAIVLLVVLSFATGISLWVGG